MERDRRSVRNVAASGTATVRRQTAGLSQPELRWNGSVPTTSGGSSPPARTADQDPGLTHGQSRSCTHSHPRPSRPWHDARMRRFDLSHGHHPPPTTAPGLPGPDIGERLSLADSAEHYAPGAEFAIGTVNLVANTGTYIATPAHRYRDRHDLSGLLWQRCTQLPTVVVDGVGAIGPETLAGHDVAGYAVLLRTGWDRHWRTARYGEADHPHITEAGARWLVEHGATLVGIDSVNIDD